MLDLFWFGLFSLCGVKRAKALKYTFIVKKQTKIKRKVGENEK